MLIVAGANLPRINAALSSPSRSVRNSWKGSEQVLINRAAPFPPLPFPFDGSRYPGTSRSATRVNDCIVPRLLESVVSVLMKAATGEDAANRARCASWMDPWTTNAGVCVRVIGNDGAGVCSMPTAYHISINNANWHMLFNGKNTIVL